MKKEEFIKELVENIFSIVGNFIYEGSESTEEVEKEHIPLLFQVLDNMKIIIGEVLLKEGFNTESSRELLTSLINHRKYDILEGLKEENTSLESLMRLYQFYKQKRS